MEEISLQPELLLEEVSLVVEAALAFQSLEVPCQNRNLWASLALITTLDFLSLACCLLCFETS